MSSKFFKIIFAAVLSIGLVGQANATGIFFQKGLNYSDGKDLWEYVDYYDMFNGKGWKGVDGEGGSIEDNPMPYNGLEAAIELGIVSGPPADIAISAFDQNGPDGLVNHMAWYDGDGAAIAMFEEDIVADGNADGHYTKNGDAIFDVDKTDLSAYVNDRVGSGGQYINYVFKRVKEVPEPSTIAIFALALCGLAVRRIKR